MKSEYAETADIETASDDYASRFSGEVGNYFLHVQSQMTLNLLRDIPSASILDVGGGHAQLAAPLIREGYSVTVTGSSDICRNRLDRFCDKGSFTYLTCDSLNLPFEDNHFDAVITFRLLPHVERWQELISEMCRVSKRAVIFDYPDRRSANILYDILFELKKNMEGNTRTYKIFNRKDIADVLCRNGFGLTISKPEFFVPMVIHRKLNSVAISRAMEFFSRRTGLTRLLGSPVIVRSSNLASQEK